MFLPLFSATFSIFPAFCKLTYCQSSLSLSLSQWNSLLCPWEKAIPRYPGKLSLSRRRIELTAFFRCARLRPVFSSFVPLDTEILPDTEIRALVNSAIPLFQSPVEPCPCRLLMASLKYSIVSCMRAMESRRNIPVLLLPLSPISQFARNCLSQLHRAFYLALSTRGGWVLLLLPSGYGFTVSIFSVDRSANFPRAINPSRVDAFTISVNAQSSFLQLPAFGNTIFTVALLT